jgi:hypothetical protein
MMSRMSGMNNGTRGSSVYVPTPTESHMDGYNADNWRQLEKKIDRLDHKIEAGEHSIAVQVARNLILRPVRWACLTTLTIVVMDKLDRRGISRRKGDF